MKLISIFSIIYILSVSFLSIPSAKAEVLNIPLIDNLLPTFTPPCEGKETAIVVRATLNTLYLCENGEAIEGYAVSLGSGGVNKRIEGDNKTPIGVYPLGEPRLSNQFYIFIPVGYPTVAEKKQGYTGGDIGIHGPKRNFEKYGMVNLLLNWTRGCIAVAYDESILEIANWIKIQKKYLSQNKKQLLVHIEK